MLIKTFMKIVMLMVILCAIANGGELTVSAAASLKDVLTEIQKVYETGDKKVVFNFGGSGSLQNQIENGAPVDVFISAAKKQVEELDKKNFLVKGSQVEIVKNDVVLIVPKSSKVNIKDYMGLTDKKIKVIGIGEPSSVPAGQYAMEIFKYIGIDSKISSKLVYGKDVRTILSWVESENADAGIVYKTDAMLSDKIKIIAKASDESHKPVVYPAAIIADTKSLNESKKFIEFLKSKKAQSIFIKFGFTPIK